MNDNKIIMNPHNFGSLAIYAIRYCHGRQSYAPDDVRGIIRPYLSQINDHDLQIMIHDCKFQEDMNLYGDEWIDKPGWLKWKEELLAEQKRRTDALDNERKNKDLRCYTCVYYPPSPMKNTCNKCPDHISSSHPWIGYRRMEQEGK